MRLKLTIFILPSGAAANASPKPEGEIELDAPNEDALLKAAHGALAVRGLRVRTVSFTPTGLVGYGEAAAS